MRLIVNGKMLDIEREMSIAEFLRSKGWSDALVAVEHNLNWTKREAWPNIMLKEDDRLEVVRVMAGG